MEELEWEEVLEFKRKFKLVNESYRLGQVLDRLIENTPDSLIQAIKLLETELERITTLRK